VEAVSRRRRLKRIDEVLKVFVGWNEEEVEELVEAGLVVWRSKRLDTPLGRFRVRRGKLVKIPDRWVGIPIGRESYNRYNAMTYHSRKGRRCPADRGRRAKHARRALAVIREVLSRHPFIRDIPIEVPGKPMWPGGPPHGRRKSRTEVVAPGDIDWSDVEMVLMNWHRWMRSNPRSREGRRMQPCDRHWRSHSPRGRKGRPLKSDALWYGWE
jgi:hypothetical protein